MLALLAWLARVDWANVLYLLGGVSGGLTVYWLFPLWTPAYLGAVLLIAGLLLDVGRTPHGPGR